jgi:DNA (cytosine-5)-methyltransferase 3A
MNVLSLFDGISCGRMALDRLNINVTNYFASEVDESAIRGARVLYPSTKHIGSVLDVKAKDLPPIDLLIGGSPCQSFSRSGDGSGFDGSSKLFWEWVRLLKEIREYNPNVKFLLENVVMKKEWEDIISKELGVTPWLIDSSIVSAQKRQRLYWTNIDSYHEPKNKNITTLDIMDEEDSFIDMPEDFLWFEGDEWRVRNATKKGYLVVNNFDTINLDFPNSKTRRGRVAKQKTNTLNTGCNQGIFIAGKIKKLTSRECGRLQTLNDNQIDMLKLVMTDNQMKHAFGNGWTVDVIALLFSPLKKTLSKVA